MKLARMATATFGAFCLAGMATPAAPVFHLSDIGVAPSGSFGAIGGAAFINDSAEITAVYLDSGFARPMYWSQANGVHTFGLFGAIHVEPLGITDAGVVYGDAGTQAFSWTVAGGFANFNPVVGGVAVIDTFVSRTGDFIFHVGGNGYIWQNGADRAATPEQGDRSLNHSAVLTGYSFHSGTWQAYHWDEGTGTTWLGSTSGYDESFGWHIDNGGTIAGWVDSSTSSLPQQAAINQGGSWTLLGALGASGNASAAYSINDNGWVVGSSTGTGFLWYDGLGMRSLESLTDSSGKGWLIYSGEDVNEHGQIVAFGSTDNFATMHLLLLSPVPEPATLSVLAIGLLAFARRRAPRRREP